MQDLNDKITGGTLSAAEWNQMPSEIQNVIEALGQVLSGSDLNQLGKAIAGYAGAATFYSESGLADAYVCNPLGSKQGPASLNADHDGLLVRFVPGNNNTGASTINVNAIGAKDVTREDGSALQSGDLLTTRDAWVRWDQSADDFVLQTFNIPGGLDVSRGYIDGFITTNAADTANDITFGAGITRDSTNADTIQLSSALTKQIDVPWAAGTNQGGFPDALLTLTTNTWYHLFLIKDTVAGTVDSGFDTSVTAANLLSEAGGNYALFRIIGSVYYHVVDFGGIRQYQQLGDRFQYNDSAGPLNINVLNPGTGEVTHTIVYSPLGRQVLVEVSVGVGRPDTASDTQYKVGPGAKTIAAPSTTSYNLRTRGDGRFDTSLFQVLTDTVRAIKTRQTESNANALINIQCIGWIDPRGKDA